MNAPRATEESRTRLAITGASGQLARRTAELVLGVCDPSRVILITRSPEALADVAARGTEVRFGDFADPASLAHAFEDAQRLLLISATDLERRVEQHEAAIRAAVAAGVCHVIYTSGIAAAPDNPAAVAPSHHATERALADSGLAWTVLRNSLYAEYQAAEAKSAIETRRLVHNRGGGKAAYVSREDCARAAAAVLVGGGHEQAVHDITGPELFSAADLAALYGKLGDCEVETVDLGDEEFIATLVGDAGSEDHMRYGAELVASFGRSIREGYMASCTDAVETLTGRAPRRLRDVLEPLVSRPSADGARTGD